MELKAKLRPLCDVDLRSRQAWEELAARAIEPNPFFEPAVALALTRHHRLDIALLTVERGADMLVCLPLLQRTVDWRGLPLPAWRTWNPLGTPLVDAPDPRPVLSCAMAHLRANNGPRLLLLDLLPSDGAIASALENVTAGRLAHWQAGLKLPMRPALRRRDDASYLAQTLHGARRRKLAWARRTVERQLGEPMQLVDESDSRQAVARLLTIERNGWKGRIGSAVACDPDRVAYFDAICAHFAHRGRLRILSLQAAGTTLAMKCDIRGGGMTFGLRTTYDQRYAAGSPGVQLEIDALNVFHASGDAMADSCTNHGGNPQTWLWPDVRPLTRLLVTLDKRAAPAWDGRPAAPGTAPDTQDAAWTESTQ